MLSLVLQGGLNPDVSSAPYFFGMMGAAAAMVFASTLAATVSCQHTNRRRVSPPFLCAPPPPHACQFRPRLRIAARHLRLVALVEPSVVAASRALHGWWRLLLSN
jgi:hypothetical protein